MYLNDDNLLTLLFHKNTIVNKNNIMRVLETKAVFLTLKTRYRHEINILFRLIFIDLWSVLYTVY